MKIIYYEEQFEADKVMAIIERMTCFEHSVCYVDWLNHLYKLINYDIQYKKLSIK